MSQAVQEMFDRISGRYDLLNRVLSARRDAAWRRFSVQKLAKRQMRILDLCGGTGDFLQAARKAERALPNSVVADFSYGMMRTLPSKGLPSGVQADALHLPFAAASFDGALCGFGMRNLDDTRSGALEVFRCLKPGGQFMTLEFFRPQRFVPVIFYKIIAPLVLPLVGQVFGSRKTAYEYLVRSIQKFMTAQEYAKMLESCGFEEVRIHDLDLGLCHLIEARRP